MEPKNIYQVLKDKIIWLELEPEKTINLRALAEDFNVSRTPLTLALTRLDAEGLVLKNGTHFMVSPLSLSRIKGITEIRLTLEIQANVWAMERITPGEIKSLLDLKKTILKVDPIASHRKNVDLDFEMHRQIFIATKNKELVEILERMLNHYLRFFLSVPSLIRQEGLSEAVEIIDAIEKKNESGLRELTERHIKGSAEQILAAF